MVAKLRCPLAGSSGIDIRRCPGFATAPVRGGDVDGAAHAYETCAHLGAGTDARGFFPACHHPEADSIVAVAALLTPRDVQGALSLEPGPALADRVTTALAAAAFALGRTRMLTLVSEDPVAAREHAGAMREAEHKRDESLRLLELRRVAAVVDDLEA